MTRNRTRAFLLAATLALGAALLASSAPEARAQNTTAPPQKQSLIKRQFMVLHMFYQAIQVCNPADIYEVHTFNYSPQIRGKMQQVFNAGGYKYGDIITVWYERNGIVVFKIKGKPSKLK